MRPKLGFVPMPGQYARLTRRFARETGASCRNKNGCLQLASMPNYFFHLAGQLPAQDLLGHNCANDKEAKDHGSFIAHRIGTEKPGMVREENYISVTDAEGREIYHVPLASTTV
jgi:hypothetical protein